MKYFIKALKNYANFKGRASRKEYWYFVLFSIIFSFVLSFIIGFIEAFIGSSSEVPILFVIYMLGMIVPSLSVAVRRLHDIGKSGNWIFIYFVPAIGGIVLIVMLATEGHHGDNLYGRRPNDNIQDDDSEILDSPEFFVGNEPIPQNVKPVRKSNPTEQSNFSKGVYSSRK